MNSDDLAVVNVIKEHGGLGSVPLARTIVKLRADLAQLRGEREALERDARDGAWPSGDGFIPAGEVRMRISVLRQDRAEDRAAIREIAETLGFLMKLETRPPFWTEWFTKHAPAIRRAVEPGEHRAMGEGT